MIQIDLRHDFGRLERAVMVLMRDQMPYAVARALTESARTAKATVQERIPGIFGKGGPPKAFTVNSLVATSASKASWRASVFMKDKQAAYLQLEETGGTRSPEGSALILPGSRQADLHDPHGNLPEGLVRRLRQAARQTKGGRAARSRASQRSTGTGSQIALPGQAASDTGIVYFSGKGPGGRGTGGYFERLPDHRIRRLTGFAETTRYRPIFGYHRIVAEAVSRVFPSALMRWLKSAGGR